MHDVVLPPGEPDRRPAGALQVSSPDPAARTAAGGHPLPAVRTLDELRQMVAVLRAEGAPTRGDKPQPTLDDLPRLVADSGLPAELVTDVTTTRPRTPAAASGVPTMTRKETDQRPQARPRRRCAGERAHLDRDHRRRDRERLPHRSRADPALGGAGLRGLRERAAELQGAGRHTATGGPTAPSDSPCPSPAHAGELNPVRTAGAPPSWGRSVGASRRSRAARGTSTLPRTGPPGRRRRRCGTTSNLGIQGIAGDVDG